jgi:hypothetical protein
MKAMFQPPFQRIGNSVLDGRFWHVAACADQQVAEQIVSALNDQAMLAEVRRKYPATFESLRKA